MKSQGGLGGEVWWRLLMLMVFQKLTEADKLYSSSAAAYMSDPRLCHTTALRLGAATPDNKHGKEETSLVGSGGGEAAGDKLIPVKEEEGVEVGGHHVVSPGVSWCDSVLQASADLGSVSGPDSGLGGLYMTGESCAVRLTAGLTGTEHQLAVSSSVPNTSHSVFSLSECVVAGLSSQPTTLSSSSSSSSVLPVTVTEVQSWPTT